MVMVFSMRQSFHQHTLFLNVWFSWGLYLGAWQPSKVLPYGEWTWENCPSTICLRSAFHDMVFRWAARPNDIKWPYAPHGMHRDYITSVVIFWRGRNLHLEPFGHISNLQYTWLCTSDMQNKEWKRMEKGTIENQTTYAMSIMEYYPSSHGCLWVNHPASSYRRVWIQNLLDLFGKHNVGFLQQKQTDANLPNAMILESTCTCIRGVSWII